MQKLCFFGSSTAGRTGAALALGLALTLPRAGAQEGRLDNSKQPPRLKRADSFLGVHFDFHAGPDCTEIGRNTTPAMIENVIAQIRPDYLQIDCKGHRGFSSYPTKVGNPAPGFVGDPLRLWREVTARQGVALYMHYSGVWDSEAILKNPSWGAINADGKTNGNATSFWSPYADRLLIPQLRELAGVYGVDGAWVDGECWAAVPDYSPSALRAFTEATGFPAAPRKPGEPHWFEFLQFHREAFRKYLRHYIAEVKKTHPGFELCSNWAYTDHMAEPVSAPVAFLSGDYSPEDSVNSARLSGRYLARQGRTWDLMAWSFSQHPGKNGSTQKTAVQLQREAAVVVALGGGFQAYITQKRDGSIREERIPVMAEVAKFCRARQAVCHHAEAVPQVALVLSTAGHYRKINGLFNRDLANVNGALQGLLENQLPVEVVGEHQLAGRLAEYPLLVVPEWDYLEPAFREALVARVKAGGSLLLLGPKTAAMFEAELGVTLESTPASKTQQLAHNGQLAPIKGQTRAVTLGPRARPFGTLQDPNAADPAPHSAASVAELGRGRIAAVYFSVSQSYLGARPEALRLFLNDLARQLFPKPMVEVKGSPDVDVSLARNHNLLLVNLVNTSGPHQREPIAESVAPVGPLQVTLRSPARPARITLEPGGQPLAFDYQNGEATLIVPRLDIHSVVTVEPGNR
jgi:hypothetical protein